MSTKARSSQTRTPISRVPVSAEDRVAARRSLWRLKSPTEVSLEAKAGEVELFAVLHMVEMLIQLARPLAPALRVRLESWIVELERRRERLLLDNRKADARRRHSSADGATR